MLRIVAVCQWKKDETIGRQLIEERKEAVCESVGLGGVVKTEHPQDAAIRSRGNMS